MLNETTVARMGDALAVRIPSSIAVEARISEGDHFDVSVQPDGSIVMRSAAKRYALADLLEGITPDNCPGELAWGPREGKEVW
jgi:antitoxin MazE